MRTAKYMRLFCFLLLISLASVPGASQPAAAPTIRVLLSEVMPGAMSADQYCTLVFNNRHFHSEKASRHHGKDTDRKVYEGDLSDAEWSSLNTIIDSPDFRDITVPKSVAPLIMQDTHPYTISVGRNGKYQNLEFLDSKSLKPYQIQIKPLLQWWKSLRAQRLPESNAPVNDHCSLDSTHAIIAQ